MVASSVCVASDTTAWSVRAAGVAAAAGAGARVVPAVAAIPAGDCCVALGTREGGEAGEDLRDSAAWVAGAGAVGPGEQTRDAERGGETEGKQGHGCGHRHGVRVRTKREDEPRCARRTQDKERTCMSQLLRELTLAARLTGVWRGGGLGGWC